MGDAETAILAAIEERLLNPNVIEPAIRRAAARLSTGHDGGAKKVRAELRQLETELARLADAVAAGGDVPVLVEAIRTREDRRQELQRQLLKPVVTSIVDVRTVIADLRVRLRDWQAILRGSIPEARALIRLLIVDRLTMQPVREGYRFSGEGSFQAVVEGAVPATARIKWRPHRDSNPGFSLERAAS
jgi:hypothetical protein